MALCIAAIFCLSCQRIYEPTLREKITAINELELVVCTMAKTYTLRDAYDKDIENEEFNLINWFEHTIKAGEHYYIGVFLVGAYQEILGDMHNLFGDTNAVHISVDDKGYSIDKIIDGETIADVLDYVQYDARKLVRTLERWVTSAVKEGKISLEEGKEFLSNYRSGLYGYTYLDY